MYDHLDLKSYVGDTHHEVKPHIIIDLSAKTIVMLPKIVLNIKAYPFSLMF